MKPCDECRLQIGLYVDAELRGQQLGAFESHLAACEACRAAVDAERRFLDVLHATRPLYSAPPALRFHVEQILQGLPQRPRQRGIWIRTRELLERTVMAPVTSGRPMLQAAAAVALLLAAVGGWWIVRNSIWRSDPHSEFEAMAVHLHELRLHGQLQLEMQASSPAAISAWFHGRVPFKVDLPSYAEVAGQNIAYEIEGARVVSFRNNPAGYIAYRTGGRPVSLISLPTTIAPPLRGKGVVMGKLTIFYDNVDGFHVITWSGPRSRLTYALVTDLEHPSQSCVLCHASSSPRDRDLMRTLSHL
jgi:anti-sigma factor RsiW